MVAYQDVMSTAKSCYYVSQQYIASETYLCINVVQPEDTLSVL